MAKHQIPKGNPQDGPCLQDENAVSSDVTGNPNDQLQKSFEESIFLLPFAFGLIAGRFH